MLVDTHCHLGHGEVEVAGIVDRARAAGVRWMIDVGIDAATTRAARERARAFDCVHFTAGLHPCDADRLGADWEEIATLAADAACVAIGESGYDFHWDRATPDEQRASFERHLELGARLGKPVVVHCREAFDATFETIARHPGVRCVMHCFSGGVREARRALELGCMLSFAGPLTYPRADALREAAASVPDDRILVETDAPFLPPHGRRGERNEPALVVAVAARLAAVRGTDLAHVAALTTANARRMFGTPP